MTEYKKKLIEVALPLEAINRESAREKSIRHGHPSTLHLWWARRPLAACRAVLFGSLIDDPSEHVAELLDDVDRRRSAESELADRVEARTTRRESLGNAASVGALDPEPTLEECVADLERERLFRIIEELVKWGNSTNEEVLDAARAEIMRSTGGNPPPVLDPFCGGGSIPLEAQRLGLEAHASDLNPVAVLITKALIEIPSRFAGLPPTNRESQARLTDSGWRGAQGLAEDVRYYGCWMREQAEQRIGHIYPKVKLPADHGGAEATVIAWLWARTVKCPNPACGAEMPLVRSFALSTKKGKQAWVDPMVDAVAKTVRFEVRTGTGMAPEGTVNRQGARCIVCGSGVPFDHIRHEGRAGRMSAQLMAVVAQGQRGRVCLAADEVQAAGASNATPGWGPETNLPERALSFRVQAYGMTKHRDLFTNRQLVALTTFSDLVAEARERVLADVEAAISIGLWAPAASDHPVVTASGYADAVATYLAFGLSKATSRNCTLAIWETGMDRLAGALGRQALPMTWDFAETNPLAGAGGDIAGTVASVAEVLDKLESSTPGFVQQLDAASATIAHKPVVSTDPPYYDNIGYADLSDFFYVWLRRSLGRIYPELFSTLLVPKQLELIATPYRFEGGKAEAEAFFENGLRDAFSHMRSDAASEYPLTVYYGFKQSESSDGGKSTASTGWERMLRGLLDAGFAVVGTWPIRSELTGALKKGIGALASSIVLVCRPREETAPLASRREFLAALGAEFPTALRHLQHGNIAPVDLAQASIGPGMAIFSRYSKVMEADGLSMSVRTALALINQALDEIVAEQEGEFDADTRWAIAWFQEVGMEVGDFGRAELLSRAKNTAVQGMVEAGIVEAKAGKVRLLRRDELDESWDPATDKRLTVWEMTQHLIGRLDEGEASAAALARQLGFNAEVARDLAYRLYLVCERKKWAQEALAYNGLVVAWPQIQRLAAAEPATAGPSQTSFEV